MEEQKFLELQVAGWKTDVDVAAQRGRRRLSCSAWEKLNLRAEDVRTRQGSSASDRCRGSIQKSPLSALTNLPPTYPGQRLLESVHNATSSVHFQPCQQGTANTERHQGADGDPPGLCQHHVSKFGVLDPPPLKKKVREKRRTATGPRSRGAAGFKNHALPFASVTSQSWKAAAEQSPEPPGKSGKAIPKPAVSDQEPRFGITVPGRPPKPPRSHEKDNRSRFQAATQT